MPAHMLAHRSSVRTAIKPDVSRSPRTPVLELTAEPKESCQSDRIDRLRRAIRSGMYESGYRLDLALDRLIDAAAREIAATDSNRR